MSDFYDKNFKSYHESTFFIDPTSFLTPLVNHLGPGATVLDIGCGSGRDLLWLKNRGFIPTGFERSANLAAIARQNTDCEIIEGDFCIFDFSKLKFNALLMIGSLVHLDHLQLPHVLSSVISALAKEGCIYLTLKEGRDHSSSQDGRIFTLWQSKQLEKIFKDLTLTVVDYSRQVSKIRTTDVWLGYLLKRNTQ